jgi:hypothetical protein
VPTHFELPRLRSLARHAIPHLIEATLIPLALFYGFLWIVGVWGALFAALGWSYAAILRRVVLRQSIPGLLVLGALGLTARTAVAFASGSVFIYFLQPTLTTVVIAGAFLLSVPAGPSRSAWPPTSSRSRRRSSLGLRSSGCSCASRCCGPWSTS